MLPPCAAKAAASSVLCPVQLAKRALSPLLLPGLDGNVHAALQCDDCFSGTGMWNKFLWDNANLAA